ncbi:prion-like-(Q/N-rich) domain-bearing protein 25 [Condylostylus longicornis]|uniref:prion-like-(Q/N-rich) domain-bearing protein 25 n=1 Tax=Condylostylus longicornis TaxID=2530218 RepID=UPI00244DEC86|nr:prion-like-(Q/N-rich) domain-bearing protein 25 [Condylostylus longicornis]
MNFEINKFYLRISLKKFFIIFLLWFLSSSSSSITTTTTNFFKSTTIAHGQEISRRRTSNVCRDHTDCPRNAFCERTPNLKNGQCVCPTGYLIITNDGGERECYRTAATIGDSCMFHEQCMITLSTESECKLGKCQCQNATHFVERANACYKSVRVGEHCSFTNNCLGEGVVCNAGYCTCPFGKHPNFDSTDCVKDIHLGEKCLHDQECLPTNSRCQDVCICRNGFSKSINNDTCLKVSNHVYDICQEDSQCTEILPHTKCDVNHKICVCDLGYHEIKYRCWVTVSLGGVCEASENCATIENSICRNERCICNENFKEINGLCSSSQILSIYQRILALTILTNILFLT